jgi:hypothetical protein
LDLAALQTEGIVELPKTTSMVFLDGGPVYWDHSANKCHFKKVSDRDFFIGTAYGDFLTAGATTMKVNLNVQPRFDIDLARDGFQSVLVGTAAAGGFGYPVNLGGSLMFELTATNEAQKVDALSVDGFAVGAPIRSFAVFSGCSTMALVPTRMSVSDSLVRLMPPMRMRSPNPRSSTWMATTSTSTPSATTAPTRRPPPTRLADYTESAALAGGRVLD